MTTSLFLNGRMEKFPVQESSIGLHSRRTAAKALGVTEKQLGKWLDGGFAPIKYRDTFIDLETAAILPMDEPPSEKVIGHIAAISLEALRRNESELAEALSSKAMRTGGVDWQSGNAIKLTLVQGNYVQMANAYAWARGNQRATSPHGLPALYQLHLDVASQARQVKRTSQDWAAWEFLHAQTLGGALGYLAGRLGLDWFAKPNTKPYRRNPERLQRIAERLLRRIEKSQWEKSGFSRDHIATRVAFNVAQIAALAKPPADTAADVVANSQSVSVFARCLVALYQRHAKRFDVVLALFENDDDTRPMLALKEIVAVIERLKAGSENNH